MATLLKVLNNLADIKSAGCVALRVRTQGPFKSVIGLTRGSAQSEQRVHEDERPPGRALYSTGAHLVP